MSVGSLFVATGLLFLIMIVRYFSVAGLFFVLVWKRPQRWRERELNADKPSGAAIVREILWSISATLIFAVPGAFMLKGWELGWTQIYVEPARHGWAYFLAGPLFYMALHDTYFYWTHRLLHQRWWFRHAHYVHHQSLSPSPWASFSFHPLESLIEALFIPALVFVVPIHVAGLLFVLTAMTIFGVINHLGYEIYPRFLVDRGPGRWFISVTHHNWHHRRFNCNYALYFRVWDIWMGTDRWPNVSAASRRGSFEIKSSPACGAEAMSTMPIGAPEAPRDSGRRAPAWVVRAGDLPILRRLPPSPESPVDE